MLTNFTYAGLKMCVGEFGEKSRKITSMIQGINAQPFTELLSLTFRVWGLP